MAVIDLGRNNLVGTIPRELGILPPPASSPECSSFFNPFGRLNKLLPRLFTSSKNGVEKITTLALCKCIFDFIINIGGRR